MEPTSIRKRIYSHPHDSMPQQPCVVITNYRGVLGTIIGNIPILDIVHKVNKSTLEHE